MPVRIPKHIQKLSPYVPGKPIDDVQREFGLSEIVKLASNENPLGPSPLAAAAIADFARFVSLYPDAANADLKSRISQKIGLSVAQICVSNGSDEMIHLLSNLLLEPGDNVVMGDPGFSRYESEAIASQAVAVKVPLDGNAVHDLDKMLHSVDERTRIFWLANPNNPTGTIIRKAELDQLLRELPDHVLLVLDEAYFEFATDPNYPNSADYIKAGKQIVGLRTFSKTYGLAGLRVGFAIGPDYIIDALERIRGPFNVNSLAQRAAVAALDDPEHLAKTIDMNAYGVKRLSSFLRGQGFDVAESFANFVWCDLKYPSNEVCNQLLRRGIIVRPGYVFGQPNHVRISVGTDEELSRFETAWSDIVTEIVRV
jgi:histidinol-phosphate aminotransferase